MRHHQGAQATQHSFCIFRVDVLSLTTKLYIIINAQKSLELRYYSMETWLRNDSIEF